MRNSRASAWIIYGAALLVGVGAVALLVWDEAVALFLRVELEATARRAWYRIACAWMQCDEART